MQIQLVADLVVMQSHLDFFEQIVPPQVKLHGIIKFIQDLALGIFKHPCQGNNAVWCYVHGAELSQFGETL